MSPRSKSLFLLLVIAQTAHSVEEYVTRLFEVFAPARFVSRLVSDDPALGFAVLNTAFVAIAVWCYVGPVRTGGVSGYIAAAVWLVIELANGLAHIGIAVASGAYFSGSLTAALLVVTAVGLAASLWTDRRMSTRTSGFYVDERRVAVRTMTGYVYVWEFLVPPEHVAAFEHTYGPDGEWVALFRRAPGYIGTLLLRDASEANRYLTIDRWRSEQDYRQFRDRYAAEYRAIDERSEGLTLQERSLGTYEG